MEVDNLDFAIQQLIIYWEGQSISFGKKTEKDFEYYQRKKNVQLPSDFKTLYSNANGMESKYPNETDNEGFLFYPLEEIVTGKEIFQGHDEIKENSDDRLIVFADYMHRSWYYGIRFNQNDNNYKVGIIPERMKFTPICNSLSEFINLYLTNSSRLYNY